MGSNDEEDTALFERWLAGDTGAGNKLVRKHFDDVAAFFNNAVGEDLRQDLAQQTFEKLIMAKGGFRRDCSVRTYIFVLARRVLFDHLRAEYRKKNQGELDPITHSIEDVDGVTASRLVFEVKRTRKLLTCLRALPVDTKQLLELYYWQDWTAEDLGKVFAEPEDGPPVPAGTIRRRVHDAAKRLRACLGREAAQSPPDEGEDHADPELDAEMRALGKLLEEGPAGV